MMVMVRRGRAPASLALALLVQASPVAAVPRGASPQTRETMALVGATIFPSPTDPPVADGVVVVRGGTIVDVGRRGAVNVPEDATVLDCGGRVLVAGFQNSHVHFSEEKWRNAARLPAARLTAQLEDMLLRYGFTTVVDTGSFLVDTLALRNRIESGDVRGPRILTAGTPLYPENGIPYYVRAMLSPEVLPLLYTPKTGDEAAAMAAKQIEAGADIVKLFTGSWVERGRVLPMPVEVARGAAREAHRRGKLVFAHPSNIAGLESAIAGGVDVLAHALDDTRGWSEEYVARMRSADMAMIPTLELFGGNRYTKDIQREVQDYVEAGGQILFGTDVGYLTDYDPSDEYALMAGAGLDWRRILASLTTAPSARFGEDAHRGRVAAGMDGDLVVLASDPATDVRAFANVVYTLRRGRVVYETK